MGRLVLPLIILWISSCSLAELAYNKFDWFVAWQVNRYIDLDMDQERLVDRAADAFIARHRSSELPRYKDFLTSVRTMSADSLTAGEVDSIFVILRERLTVLLEMASDEAAALLVSLSPGQINEMEKRMEKINRDHDEDEPSDDSNARHRRVATIRKRIEYWIGRLNDDQAVWLESFVMQMPSSTNYWLEHRRWRQQQLLAILRGRNSQEEKLNDVRLWIMHPEDYRSEDYIKTDLAVRKAYTDLIVTLHRRLEPAQRIHLQEILDNFIHITEDLARKS